MDYRVKEFAERLRHVMRVYLVSGEAHAARFSEAQRDLDLAAMLQPEALLSGEARMQSRGKLDALRELFDRYKAYYAGFGINVSRDLLTLSSDLPENVRQALIEQATTQMQAHMAEQAQFYQWRERWFTAVFQLLDFFDHGPTSAHLTDDGKMGFSDDAEFERYDSLAGEINDVARRERELMQLRKARLELRKAATKL
jgi:hypothetical protein